MIKVLLPSVLTAFSTIACSSALAERPPSSFTPSPAACEAAQAALAVVAEKDSTSLFSKSPPGWASSSLGELEDSDLQGKWQGQAPRSSTIAPLTAALATSALKCVDVAAAASTKGKILEDSEGLAQLKAIGFNGRYVFLYRLSMPAFSPRGDEALVVVSSASNQLAGGTSLIFLKRIDGRWQVVGRKVLTVS